METLKAHDPKEETQVVAETIKRVFPLLNGLTRNQINNVIRGIKSTINLEVPLTLS